MDNVKSNHSFWNNNERWIEDGEEWSGQFGDTENLWNSLLHPRIGKFLRGDVLELACGRGRITRKLLQYNPKSLDIQDLSSNCINRCRERFGNDINNYVVGNGSSLEEFESDSKDFILSFDSFVHINEEVIDSYLNEIYRVLKPGGYCWLHHAHLSGGDVDNFNNWAGRSNFDIWKFRTLANKYNFNLISQELINWKDSNPEWGNNPDWLSDGLSLIHKTKYINC